MDLSDLFDEQLKELRYKVKDSFYDIEASMIANDKPKIKELLRIRDENRKAKEEVPFEMIEDESNTSNRTPIILDNAKETIFHFKLSKALEGHSKFTKHLLSVLKEECCPVNKEIHWIAPDATEEELKYILGFMNEKPKNFTPIKWTYSTNKGPSKPQLFRLLYALGYEAYININNYKPAEKADVYKTYNDCFTFYDYRTCESNGCVKRNSFQKDMDYSPNIEVIDVVDKAIKRYKEEGGQTHALETRLDSFRPRKGKKINF